MFNDVQKKTCFVITPIGNDGSEIRRHIDGIIDQSISPAIGDRFIIKVAHREYETGSINDRVIRSVYESDLVIANLTNLNPNVMFELALRYSFGKPAIVIAEKGTMLPFDIVEQNTIFYINDPSGADELRNAINKFEKNINYNSQEYGPIFRIIQKLPLYNAVEAGEKISNDNLMEYIINRLDNIEKAINREKNVYLPHKRHYAKLERPSDVPTDKLIEIQNYLQERYDDIDFLFDERQISLMGNSIEQLKKAREEIVKLL